MNIEMLQQKILEYFSENPNFCAYAGLDKNLGDLPDPGKNKRITNQGKIKMLKKPSKKEFLLPIINYNGSAARL